MARIHLAAKMQAYILAFAKSNPTEVFTTGDLATHVEVRAMQAAEHHIISACSVLHKSGLLERVRIAKGRARYGYALPIGLAPKTPTPPAPAPATPEEVHVEVNKATGALLVEYKGLRLTISMKE